MIICENNNINYEKSMLYLIDLFNKDIRKIINYIDLINLNYKYISVNNINISINNINSDIIEIF